MRWRRRKVPRPEVNDGLGCVNIRDNDRDEWHGVELIHCAEQRTYAMKTPHRRHNSSSRFIDDVHHHDHLHSDHHLPHIIVNIIVRLIVIVIFIMIIIVIFIIFTIIITIVAPSSPSSPPSSSPSSPPSSSSSSSGPLPLRILTKDVLQGGSAAGLLTSSN